MKEFTFIGWYYWIGKHFKVINTFRYPIIVKAETMDEALIEANKIAVVPVRHDITIQFTSRDLE